jgi:hypothetical protein
MHQSEAAAQRSHPRRLTASEPAVYGVLAVPATGWRLRLPGVRPSTPSFGNGLPQERMRGDSRAAMSAGRRTRHNRHTPVKVPPVHHFGADGRLRRRPRIYGKGRGGGMEGMEKWPTCACAKRPIRRECPTGMTPVRKDETEFAADRITRRHGTHGQHGCRCGRCPAALATTLGRAHGRFSDEIRSAETTVTRRLPARLVPTSSRLLAACPRGI